MARPNKIDREAELNFDGVVDKIHDKNRVYGVLDDILNSGEEFAREQYGDDIVDKELMRMQKRRSF